ncbi:MAG: hypothetical protein ABH805_01340 [Candidatus Nealsonbacteria bacterium]
MSDLKVRCIKCGKEWIKDGGNLEWKDNDPSGSLCDDCFAEKTIPLIRRKQIKEGYSGCFAETKEGHCDQEMCKYRKFCFKIGSLIPNTFSPNILHL